ncbi:MAG: hypothetical protein OJF59_002093 [Cytophagales bacterium]|jgi:hypothetical protein|nr:hypothetical protein [Bacteroidota bacterium]MBS1980981.1 hypothetical protein [Bacteroidota bacterium]WHZ08340.1 MAG: hypothetical protein OJF59_002093 [Cytophagales bacterium]
MKPVLSLILALGIAAQSSSQQLSENQRENYIQRARQQLDASCREGRLRKFALKNNISGNANFNITLGRNGNIETVFLVDSDITETSARNGLIMELSKVTLKEIPIPKKDRIKFSYHLTL